MINVVPETFHLEVVVGLLVKSLGTGRKRRESSCDIWSFSTLPDCQVRA